MTKKAMKKCDNNLKTKVKEKCVTCFKGPTLFKTVVILACLGVVIQQVTICTKKLINKPITTYTHFDFNQTLLYPSVTFCREPPYKFDKLEDYGLFVHPRFTSVWRNFDFEKYSLEDLWLDITYNETEFFVAYGLNSAADNVDLIPTRGFVFGTCFTLSPKILTMKASRETGYSVTLKHTKEDLETTVSIFPPGYHVYIHYQREPYTEIDVTNGGLVDYLYVNTGEELDIKLTVDEYVKISEDDDLCTYQQNYSANQCTTRYVWDTVTSETECSGPWMISDYPPCNNYTQMRELIRVYMNTYQNHQCTSCPRFCKSFLYNGFVTNRQKNVSWDSKRHEWTQRTGDAALETTLYLHFNSMMVSVYEERYNYDWNIFLSDLGGSIGFLLGLSVIGFLKIVEKVWGKVIKPLIRSEKRDTESEADTVVVKEVHKEYINKCDQWNKNNDYYNKN